MKPLPPDSAKRACLDKVAASRAFARAEQLRQLLLWLGEKALSGGAPPSEYEVALGALRKSEDFDPQTDSLVRKEMSRLRAKLRDYYLGEGQDDPLRVGADDAYHLRFEPVSRVGTSGAADGVRCLLVLPLYAPAGLEGHAEEFCDELRLQLAAIDRLQFVAHTTARRYASRSGDVRDFAAETGADLVLEGAFRARPDGFAVSLWLVDGRTGRTWKPWRRDGADLVALAAEAVRWFSDLAELP